MPRNVVRAAGGALPALSARRRRIPTGHVTSPGGRTTTSCGRKRAGPQHAAVLGLINNNWPKNHISPLYEHLSPGPTVWPLPRSRRGVRTVSMATRQDRRAYAALVQDPVSLCGIGAVTGYGWGHKLFIEGLLSGSRRSGPLRGSPRTSRTTWRGGRPSRTRATRGRIDTVLPGRAASAREAVHNAYDRGWRPGAHGRGSSTATCLGDVAAWRAFHHRGGFHTSKRQIMSLMPSTVLSSHRARSSASTVPPCR